MYYSGNARINVSWVGDIWGVNWNMSTVDLVQGRKS